MNRRRFLQTSGFTSAVALAGCAGLFETQTTPNEPPLVENRPDAVYYPTHTEGMEMAGMAKQGRWRLGLMYSFPHRFWLMGGGTAEQQEKVTIEDGDDVHLMATVWDAETMTVLPAGDVRIELSKGDWSDTRTMWPMLSQNMGFHFGDNMGLDGDGTYTADVQVSGLSIRRTGALAGEFGSAATLSTEFEVTQEKLENLPFEELDQKKGSQGAVPTVEMDMMPTSTVPPKADLPGQFIGEQTSGDAKFLATAVKDTKMAEETYLLVSPRTPYRSYPIPMMSLSTSLNRGGESVFDGTLKPTLDPEIGYHYGANVSGIKSGDELLVSVDSVPQVSRHEGYETAFLKMPKMTFSV
ncbi:iron transporter [Haladaptatus pallidirubidus]|uniref:iron transporter n=1 Tax=Haladaptatus pallidirubidus TaxID=1008152 RepID=UPI001D121792|nr:iron transporter [Haladaptatus pallidirubidus]